MDKTLLDDIAKDLSESIFIRLTKLVDVEENLIDKVKSIIASEIKIGFNGFTLE